MIRQTTAAFGLGVLSLLAWLGGCSDGQGVTDPPPSAEAAIVSDPRPSGTTALPARRGEVAALAVVQAVAETDVAYVTLPPRTVSNGVTAVIRNPRVAGTVRVSISDGGFDPVPVAASAGDVVQIDVLDAGGATLARLESTVPARRRPRVIRTVPPRGKTDVPVNQSIVIVFSEPVAAATLSSSSVQLLRGASAVPGTVRLVDGVTAAAVFEPAAALEANTQYQVVVTQSVTDLGGDPLEARVTAEFTTGTTTVGSVARVTVLPDIAAIQIGSQVQLAAAADSNGTLIPGRPVAWSSDDPAVATVSASGLVTAHAEGVARVRAEVDGVSGFAVVSAGTLPPVDFVEVSPQSAKVLINGFLQLRAALKDAAGNLLPFRPVTWTSSAPAVATVTVGPGGTVVVTGTSAGTATITATSEGKRGTATITVGNSGPYAQIIPDASHTCALATDGAAWCWGLGSAALGNGTLLSTRVPTAVAGEWRFSQIGATPWLGHCALTPEGAAYCWGDNAHGGLGIGTTTGPEDCAGFPCSTRPVPMSGPRFGSLATGGPCALTQSGAAYCWGLNQRGSLGIGSTTGPEDCRGYPCSTAPVAVTGGLTLTAISGGSAHVCALDAGGAAYCWGWNVFGQLGDGTTTDRSSPTPVAGGLTFVKLSAGYASTCGLTPDGTAYCWGSNEYAQLGIGTLTGPESCENQRPCSTVPVRVAGDGRWASVSVGQFHACAVTPAGVAYCWGSNVTGALGIITGDGTTPTPVAGGLTFASVNAGVLHSCGVTVAGVAYCWGDNVDGQLGDGTGTRRQVPVRVAGQP